MKLRKSILLPILALLAVVAVGFILTRSTGDDVEETDQTQVYIQDPNPENSAPPRDIADTTPTAPEPVVDEKKVEAPVNDGKVLGETEKPRVSVTPQPKPAPAPTTYTVRYSPVGIEVTVPISWKVRTEQNNRGNVIYFYNQTSTFGTIEVIIGYESLQQFENELRADSRVTSVTWTNFNGHTALMYYTAEKPGVHYALYINGKLYILNGNSVIDRFNYIRFF